MTIWLLAVVLLASLAGLGYRQGAIRVAFSLLGILVGALLAVPLGHLLRPALVSLGIKNPLLPWFIAPVIVFAIVLTLFKIGGLAVHKKVEVHYKYKAGDLRLALWERLNQRAGLCLGLANAIAYMILISFVIYVFSYWTVQLATSDKDPWSVRILNRMGLDLGSTGMEKVARAVDKMPSIYYKAADFAGKVFHTPLAEGRLSRYPGFLDLGERPEFQDLGNDSEFTKLRLQQKSIGEVIKYPKIDAMLKNFDLLKTIWAAIEPNLQDIDQFLTNGVSIKYPEPILGRWYFDVRSSMALFRGSKPNIRSSEMLQLKNYMEASFTKTTFVATPQQSAFLKNVPRVRPASPGAAPGMESQTWQGQWKSSGGKYTVSINGNELSAEINGERLELSGAGLAASGAGTIWSFVRQD